MRGFLLMLMVVVGMMVLCTTALGQCQPGSGCCGTAIAMPEVFTAMPFVAYAKPKPHPKPVAPVVTPPVVTPQPIAVAMPAVLGRRFVLFPRWYAARVMRRTGATAVVARGVLFTR